VDLAGPAEAAARRLADAGVGARCEIVAGSFFEALPAGGDAYILSGVPHDWDDAHALQILRRCAEAAGTGARVLAMEHCELEGAAESALRSGMDLRMLALTGGGERTLRDFEQLAADAGLRVSAAHRATRYRSVIDLRA
jgi:2,7-dihydroxy-5-methyl-1-naphthoate 7-O-methyltransferase